MRCITGAWLIIGVILYATYAANLTAILAVNYDELPFNTLEEMVAQTEFKYGVLQGTVALLIFQVS